MNLHMDFLASKTPAEEELLSGPKRFVLRLFALL